LLDRNGWGSLGVALATASLRVRAKRWRVAATALLLALAAHGLFVAILVWQRPWAEVRRGEVIDVQLMSRPTLSPRARSFPPSPSLHASTAASTRPLQPESAKPAPAPVASTLPTQSEPSPATGAPPPHVADDGVGNALRGAFGCDFAAVANLTPDERLHCQDRFNAARQGPAAQEFGVAPAKRAIFEANAKRALWWTEPFLATTPKNGCAPKVTNQQIMIPGGARTPSDWRAGVSCGKSF
jgi:hypothetical protein